MRSVRAECLSAAVILTVPLGIVLSFPFAAFDFKAAEGTRQAARTAFVTLTPEAEQVALRAVRTSWRERKGGVRQVRADLFCAELPDDARFSVLSVRDRSHLPPLPAVGCERTPFLPSQRAFPPSPIAAKPASDPLPFPREELLKMN